MDRLRPDLAGLELDVAQALFAARMLEASVHDPGPWTFQWGDIEIPAERRIAHEGVVFVGRFPDVCYLRRPEGGLLIRCNGTIMGMRSVSEFEHPGDTGFVVRWSVIPHREGISQ